MFYVTMTDKFMSGWGLAEGKTNKLVIECETLAEAEIVESNARRRSEMKHINITNRKPYYSPRRYYVSWHNKQDYGSWFKPFGWIEIIRQITELALLNLENKE